MKLNSIILFFSLIFSGLTFGQEAAKTETPTKKVVLSEDNSVYFGSSFNWTSVAKLQNQIKELDTNLPPHKPIYIVIDSGGGMISAGLELIDNLKSIKREIKTVTLFGASMAFQTVQGLGERLVMANGTLMSHKARGGFYGEFGDGKSQLDSRYNFWLRKLERLDLQTVNRAQGKVSLEEYRDLYENEYWCDGEDCVSKGFADAVAIASCDDSLAGSKSETRKFFFFGRKIKIVITRAKCPLITGVLDFKVYIDGRSMFDSRGGKFYYGETEEKNSVVSQEVWNFVQKQVTKQALPERVIYMEIPSRKDNPSLGPSNVSTEVTQ